MQNAEATLRELARLDDAARRPRTQVWFPLLVFGLVDIPGAGVVLVIGRGLLGRYFLPMNLLGGLICVWYYRRIGRTTGIQAPALVWLGVILAATVLGAMCSFLGRAWNWDALNLGGPFIAQLGGYSVLGIWARSTTMLWLVGVGGLIVVAVLSVASGDVAISLNLVGFAAAMLTAAAWDYQRYRSLV